MNPPSSSTTDHSHPSPSPTPLKKTNNETPTIFEMMVSLPYPNIASISSSGAQNYYAKSAAEAFHAPPTPVPSDNGTVSPFHVTSFLPYPLAWTPVATPQALQPEFGWLAESCGGRATMGVVGGGVMGLLMGVFLSAMSDVTPPVTVVTGRMVPAAPMKEQMRHSLRTTGDKSLYWARNFAFITGVFSGSECLVEKARGKHDVWNPVMSGCATGAAMQAKSGPQAAALGCAGFAAFSLAIEAVMGH
mmetsp:Transcript_36004/g.70845  ORF Transcript_36004/g.70845 Transcript_36004/m.70845 type:complete len:246 (+) Transcript_36004:139-876(+)